MNFVKRAFLYSYRKIGKSLIVFLILLIMATLALTGITIKKASVDAEVNLRQSLGGGLLLEQDQSDQSKWVSQQISGGSSASYYNGPKITKELVEKVAKTPGIKAYNIENYCPVVLEDKNANQLSLFIPQDSIFTSNGDLNQTASLYADSDTAYSNFFSNKTLKLVQGRHINGGDRNAVIISRALADKNHLKLGDKIIITINETITGTQQQTYNKAECEIVGLFDSATKQQTSKYTTTEQMTENVVFMDIDTYINKILWTNEGYNQVHFTVDDPLQLDKVKNQVLQLKGIDWKAYKVSLDDQAYEAASASIKNLDRTMNVMLVLVILFSIAILSLFLLMWVRGRIREVGILLSAGIPKSKVIMQHITELIMIAIIAFGLSFFTSTAISQRISASLINSSSQSSTESKSTPQAGSNTFTQDMLEPQATPNVAKVTNLKANVQPVDLVWIYLFGSAIIISSVLLSSASIYRLSPKQILSKMK